MKRKNKYLTTMALTPEKRLERFMKAVQARHIPRIYSNCQLTWKKNNTKNKLLFYQQIKVRNVVIGEVERINNGEAVKVYVEFDYQVLIKPGVNWIGSNGRVIDNEVKRMCSYPIVICEKAPYTPDLSGTWGVNPISFMKMKEVDAEQRKN